MSSLRSAPAIAFLAKEKPSLELSTTEICFLAALHQRASSSNAPSFREDELTDIFEQVAALLDADAKPSKSERKSSANRAGHALRRMREQRVLTRVDAAGVLRSGDYALTRLGTAIVEFYLEEEALTRESLSLLMRTLLTSLAEVAANAARARTRDDFRTGVAAPLRILVGDLARGIERRQRGFDLQQVEAQREIGTLLHAEWFGAVEKSQSLLELTTSILRDLNQALLQDTHEATTRLSDILDSCAQHAQLAAEADLAARDAMESLDRIAAWGSARQRAWSEYYQYVHRYLRDVVRLDPSRVLSQRLREQLAGASTRGWALTVAASPSIRLLRAVMPPAVEKPPVKRPRKPREADPVETPLQEDPQAVLRAEVRDALATGAADLGEVTARLTHALPAHERFIAAGRIAQAVAEVGDPSAEAERPWVELHDGIAIEDWQLAEPKPEGEP